MFILTKGRLRSWHLVPASKVWSAHACSNFSLSDGRV